MSKIYCVVKSYYEELDIEGYFLDKELAEKYCALKRVHDDYYSYDVVPVDNIENEYVNNQLNEVELKYLHEVVIDINMYYKNGKIRNEPNRYSYYVGEDKRGEIRFNRFFLWVSFKIPMKKNDREKAEEIASSLFEEFMKSYKENEDFELSIKILADRLGYDYKKIGR